MTRQSLSRVPLLTVVQPFFCQPPEGIWPQRHCAAEVHWAGLVCQDLAPLSLKAQESGGWALAWEEGGEGGVEGWEEEEGEDWLEGDG